MQTHRVAACDLILEYTLSAAAIAKGFTAYMASLCGADLAKIRLQVMGSQIYVCMCVGGGGMCVCVCVWDARACICVCVWGCGGVSVCVCVCAC